MDDDKLIVLAKEASLKAYAPYSHYMVGACVLLKDGKFIQASNVENASYSLCMCAERNAIFHAYNEGYRKADFLKLCIYVNSDSLVLPCGACLQVINECCNQDMDIIVCNDKQRKYYQIEDLFPHPFGKENL